GGVLAAHALDGEGAAGPPDGALVDGADVEHGRHVGAGGQHLERVAGLEREVGRGRVERALAPGQGEAGGGEGEEEGAHWGWCCVSRVACSGASNAQYETHDVRSPCGGRGRRRRRRGRARRRARSAAGPTSLRAGPWRVAGRSARPRRGTAGRRRGGPG